MRRYLVLLVALFIVGSPVPAFAHAELTASSPTNGAMLLDAPKSIELRWSEPVTVGADQLSLLDATGHAVKIKTTIADEDVMSATIEPVSKLADGLWAVSWKAVSADGHLVTGVVGFQVGTSSDVAKLAPGVNQNGSATGTSTASTTATDTTAATTAVDFTPLTKQPLDRTAESLSWLGAIVGVAALILGRRRLGLVAGTVTAATAVYRIAQNAQDFGGNPFVIGESKAAAAVAVAGLGVVVGSSIGRKSSRNSGAIAFVLMAFAAQSFFSGHQLDLSGIARSLGIAAHSTHLLAVLTWCAAVLALFLVPTVAQARVTRRLATGAITALFVAGPVLAVVLVQPQTFTEGRLWMLVFGFKLALVGVAFGLGARNHRRLAPEKLEEATDAEVKSTIRKVLAAEVVVLVLVAFASALLTQSRPPAVIKPLPDFMQSSTVGTNTDVTVTPDETGSTSTPTSTSASAVEPFRQKLVFDDGTTAELEMSMPVAGRSATWMLTVKDADGTPVDVVAARLEASLPSAGIEGLVISLAGTGGHLMTNTALPLPGLWMFKVVVQTDEFTELSIDTKMEIA